MGIRAHALSFTNEQELARACAEGVKDTDPSGHGALAWAKVLLEKGDLNERYAIFSYLNHAWNASAGMLPYIKSYFITLYSLVLRRFPGDTVLSAIKKTVGEIAPEDLDPVED